MPSAHVVPTRPPNTVQHMHERFIGRVPTFPQRDAQEPPKQSHAAAPTRASTEASRAMTGRWQVDAASRPTQDVPFAKCRHMYAGGGGC